MTLALHTDGFTESFICFLNKSVEEFCNEFGINCVKLFRV